MTDGTMIDAGCAQRRDRRRSLLRLGQGRGGHGARRPQRASCTELGLAMENLGDIDRQTVAGAISTGTHGTGAKLRNISSQVEAMELVLGRRLGARAERPTAIPSLLRAARVSIGALGAIYVGDPALRPRLHPAPGRHARSARGGVRALPGARRRARALRALHLPLRGLGAGARAQPHRGAAAPARPRRRLPQRRRAGELGTGGDLGRRQGLPARRSPRSRASPPGSPRAARRPIAATGSLPTSAASASPRWSTGCRASTGPRRRGG